MGRSVNILVINKLGRAEEDEIRWSPQTSNAERGAVDDRRSQL